MLDAIRTLAQQALATGSYGLGSLPNGDTYRSGACSFMLRRSAGLGCSKQPLQRPLAEGSRQLAAATS